MSPLIIAIAGAVLLVLFIAMFVLSRIKVAGPNEAFIVTGRKGRSIRAADGTTVTDLSGQKVVMGAAVFVMPVVQRLHQLDLSSREIPVSVTGAVSAQGIRCDADAVAIVKVGGTAEMIRPAAQRFLHQQARIEMFTGQVLSGALRSVVGRLTVEQIIRDRAAFAAHVAEEAESALTHQGLILDAFQLEDIRTAGSYLQDLGRPEAARVLKAAAIAEAQARQTAETERMKAEEARLTGEGERGRRAALADAAAIEGAKQGEAEQRRRTAIADAVEREGTAEASAILARGQAEAEAMQAKAAAFNQYGEAAVLDLLVRVLPQVVEKAAAPMAAIDKMTVISTDGASTLTKNVAANVAQGLQLGTDLTGIDLAALLAKLGNGTGTGTSDPKAVEAKK